MKTRKTVHPNAVSKQLFAFTRAGRSGVCSPLTAVSIAAVFASALTITSSGGRSEIIALLIVTSIVVVMDMLRTRRPLATAISLLFFVLFFTSLLWTGIPVWLVQHEMPQWMVHVAAALWQMLGWSTHVVGPGMISIRHETGWIDVSLTVEKLGHCSVLALLLWLVMTIGASRARLVRKFAVFVLVVALLFALVLIRPGVLSAFDMTLNWVSIYWLPWVEFLSFLPIAAAAGAVVHSMMHADVGVADEGEASAKMRSGVLASVALLLLGGLLSASIWLDPPGQARRGAILIDDARSDWSWAAGEFGPDSFGERETYTYRSLCHLLRHYWRVEVNESERLTPERLAGYSVLVLKMPTEAWSEEEIDAIERFVHAGGGLWLIGDHTNLFGSTDSLNAVASRFGVYFRNDNQFDLTTGGPTRMSTGAASVPFLLSRGFPELAHLTFLTSCTIRGPVGRGSLIGFAQGVEPGDYSHVNFFGNIRIDRDESWGAFEQMVSVRHGLGRVIAFSDSTVFSDFCLWDDAKAALAVRTVDLLDREHGRVLSTAVSSLHSLAGTLWFVSIMLGGVIAGRYPIASFGFAAGVGLGTILSAAASSQELPLPERPLQHVQIHEDWGAAVFPSFLNWEIDVITNPNAFDQFALCWARIGYAPLRNGLLGLTDPPSAHVILYPSPVRRPDAGIEQIRSWLSRGEPVMILAESGNAHQRAAMQSLLEELDIAYRAVAVTGPILPTVPGLDEPGPRSGQDRVARLELADPEEIFVLPRSGLWIQTVSVGDGRLVLVDGAMALSRRCAGMVFMSPGTFERVLADFMMALQRYTIEPMQHREELIRRAEAVERHWPDAM